MGMADTHKTIYVLNGPDANLPGTSEPDTAGCATLGDVESLCVQAAARFGLIAECRQSTHEGVLVDAIREAGSEGAAGIILNASAYSPTSVARRDALMGVNLPMAEVHIGNTSAPERFRHHSFTAKAAFASIRGFGIEGYRLAITGLAAKIGAKTDPQTDIMAQA
ncbi:type II 3-dehydroquinate dehydratase [Bradyrhizobium sp. HKCCYLS2038]|uniref:type II 3-dehydroquinate dehydratase n=1 Tax=unclassified Bradyrhizobium TaxID=2631580 RepID=UPI003EBACEAB